MAMSFSYHISSYHQNREMLLSLNVSLVTKVLLALLNHFSTASILSSQAQFIQVNMAQY